MDDITVISAESIYFIKEEVYALSLGTHMRA